MKTDRSKKGSYDEDIVPLLRLINSFTHYKTTSSCSGRIVLLSIPNIGDKNHAEWLYVSHEAVSPMEIYRIIQTASQPVWFLQEPVILHINCKTQEAAGKLLEAARKVGFKRSGIFSLKNYSLELQSTERMETILSKELPKEYVILLVNQANQKLARTKEKIKNLYRILFARSSSSLDA